MSWGGHDLAVELNGQPALEGVSVAVDPGSIVAVLGGDGAGKTTLLKVLAGSLEPVGGTVDRPESEQIGYLSAGPGIYPDLTAQENLDFSGAAYGLGGDSLRKRIAELLDVTKLGEARDRLARNLSGGMRQKLALAAALLHRPELLVLDEPTTGVDPVSRAELWRLIAGAAAAGAAVVVATSYVDEAERAGYVIVLDESRVLMEGHPQAVARRIKGHVFELPSRPPGGRAWRRGRKWRVWAPDGNAVAGGTALHTDLEDAVLVAQLESGGHNEAEAS